MFKIDHLIHVQEEAAWQEAQCVRLKRLCSAMKSSEDVYQTILRLEGYAQLALWVRAIKYLGIYRHIALPELVARRDIPRTRCVGDGR